MRAFFALLTILVGMGTARPILAQNAQFGGDGITINQRPTNAIVATVNYVGTRLIAPYNSATYVPLGTTATNPARPNPQIGTYDITGNNTSSLVLSAGSIVAQAPSGFNVNATLTGARLIYQVYLTASGPSSATTLTSGTVPLIDRGANPGGGELFDNTTTTDLLSALPGGGNYTLAVVFQVDVRDNNSANGTVTFTNDPSSSYQLNFTITSPNVAPPGATTVWLGGGATTPGFPGGFNNWLNPNNWTNGVPTTQSNAIIPSRPNPRPYEPVLNDPNATYVVRDLTLEGTGTANRALLRITTATLRLFGDLMNPNFGILATTDQAVGGQNIDKSANVVFAGGNQVIDDGRFANVFVENNIVNADGTYSPGTTPVIKSLTDELDIPGSLNFLPDVKAIIRTSKRASATDPTLVLDKSQTIVVNLISSGSITGETNTAFVLGVMKADRVLTTGVPESFGNIGIDITINSSLNIGRGYITRTVGDPYAPFQDANGNPIPGTARSVKRIFGNSFASLQAGYNADVRIHYQNSADLGSNSNSGPGTYNELNGNPDGNLAIYRTTSNATFQKLPSVDVINPTPNSPFSNTAGYVESIGLNNINTLTLADGSPTAPQLPLPIVLSAFDVKRTGGDAIVMWSTASERNSKGFYVEVSKDGNEFRSLGFVASTAANSSTAQNYRFVDAEGYKSGNRYYRLHQVDLDGKNSLSPVKVVDFGTGASAATSATLLGYPNPFTSELNVSIAGAGNGAATLRLTDLAGRTIRTQQVSLEGASSNLKLDGLGDLKAGTYIMQMTTPSGKTQTFKVQK